MGNRPKIVIHFERGDHCDYVYEQFGEAVWRYLKESSDKETRVTTAFIMTIRQSHKKRKETTEKYSFKKPDGKQTPA